MLNDILQSAYTARAIINDFTHPTVEDSASLAPAI